MKTMILVILAMGLSNIALAQDNVAKCQKMAETTIWKHTGDEYDGYDTFNCQVAPNGKVVICTVAASKGNGAATDTWQVVMNRACNWVFSAKMTGEE